MPGWLSIAEKKEFAGLKGAVPRKPNAPPRLVLHTTETKGLPNYSAPPHFTIGVGHPGSMPSLPAGSVKIWQHVALGRTAYALRHPAGTEETNHMGSHCVQIEIITYVANQPGIVGNRGKLPDPLFKAVADLVAEILQVIPGIPLAGPPPSKWSASDSYGQNAPQRFTAAEWREFNGICGHQHVPFNSHWDPGALDITGFLALVAGDGSVGPRLESETDTPGATAVADTGWPGLLTVGDRNHKVVVVRGILQALGYGNLGDSDMYTSRVADALEHMQQDSGIRVDGIWGPKSHRAARDQLADEMARPDLDT